MMPKGRSKVQHKGRGKKYLTEEEIRIAEEKKTREKEWKRKKGINVESSESEEEEESVAMAKGQPRDLPPAASSEEEQSSEEDAEIKQQKQKGVDGMIEVENPNRVTKKTVKAKDIDINAKVELSRREREELEKQKSAAAYQRLHQAGKTDEARRDLARLALIRQQREESARKGRKTAKIHTADSNIRKQFMWSPCLVAVNNSMVCIKE